MNERNIMKEYSLLLPTAWKMLGAVSFITNIAQIAESFGPVDISNFQI